MVEQGNRLESVFNAFQKPGLRLVRKWPRHPMLPIGEHVSITVRHFDLRQILSVDDLVLRNNTIFVEQKGGYGVYLVGFERALFSERHAAVDVIPYRRRVWRMEPHYISPPDTR